jgi:hypothetical protein
MLDVGLDLGEKHASTDLIESFAGLTMHISLYEKRFFVKRKNSSNIKNQAFNINKLLN